MICHDCSKNSAASFHWIYIGVIAVSFILILGCASDKQYADTILFNGKIITVDKNFSVVEAVAIKDGKILLTGVGFRSAG